MSCALAGLTLARCVRVARLTGRLNNEVFLAWVKVHGFQQRTTSGLGLLLHCFVFLTTSKEVLATPGGLDMLHPDMDALLHDPTIYLKKRNS